MNEPTPLPCPFCGSEPDGISVKGGPESELGCFAVKCWAHPLVKTKDWPSAIALWNTRHTPEADTAPKVDEQLEKDIELVRKAAAKEQREIYPDIGFGKLLEDTPVPGSQSAAIARTILHLLKR